jgi:hypothetical protein
MVQKNGAYSILVRKHEKKITLGKPRCRWESNIKIDIKEIECSGMNLSQDRNQWQICVTTGMYL